MKVITIGGATKDLFLHYKYPDPLLFCSGQDNFIRFDAGKKIELESVQDYLGGGGTNTAVSFTRLGLETNIICKVGIDAAGIAIVDQLKKEQVNTDLVTIDKECSTAESFILPACEGNSALLVYRGANTHLATQDIPLNQLDGYSCLYMSSLNGPAAQLVKPISEAAKKQNLFVAINPGMSQLCEHADTLEQSLANIDVLILNNCEAREFMLTLVKNNDISSVKEEPIKTDTSPQLLQAWIEEGEHCFNLMHYFKEILKRGPSTVVVTNDAEGVYVAHGGQVFFHPSIKTEIVSTVGAGDAFGSCFVASLMNKQPIEQAIGQGVLNSASVLKHESTQEGLLTAQELKAQYASLNKDLIQRFELDRSTEE